MISVFSTGYFTGENTGAIIVPILAAIFPDATHTQLLAMHHFIRKLGHFTEYLILSVLLYRALRGGRCWSLQAGATAGGGAGPSAGRGEVAQRLVPGRPAAGPGC